LRRRSPVAGLGRLWQVWAGCRGVVVIEKNGTLWDVLGHLGCFTAETQRARTGGGYSVEKERSLPMGAVVRACDEES